MCRMLIAAGDVNVSELLDAAVAMAKDETSLHELNNTEGQGSWLHDDGWGIAWLEGEEWKSFKSTKAIFSDPQVAQFMNLKTEYVMIHIRKRMGSETAIENTHPFHLKRNDVGNFVFCHNGYAGETFSFCQSFVPKGKTDSEQLFYSVLSYMKTEGIQESLSLALAAAHTTTGSNIILANSDKSFIALKENHYPKYYTMHIGRQQGSVIISSEKLTQFTSTDFRWQEVSAGKIISLDHRNLNIEISTQVSHTTKTIIGSQ